MTEIDNTSASQTPNWLCAHTNVYASGELVATYDADLTGATEGTLSFQLSDWLDTRGQQADYAGNPSLNFIGLPFVDGPSAVPVSTSSTTDATEHHFTGKELDSESGTDPTPLEYLVRGHSVSPRGLRHTGSWRHRQLRDVQLLGSRPLPSAAGSLICMGHEAMLISRIPPLPEGPSHGYTS